MTSSLEPVQNLRSNGFYCCKFSWKKARKAVSINLNLETAVQDNKVMQDFDLESLPILAVSRLKAIKIKISNKSNLFNKLLLLQI